MESSTSTQHLDAERAVTGATMPQRSSSSNNILNSNLSGSFKRCSRYHFGGHRNTNESGGGGVHDDDDDDSLDDGVAWDTVNRIPHTTIFAPISASQPSALNTSSSQYEHIAESSSSHHYLDDGNRGVVAAIPNMNFTQPFSRAIASASSPSIYTPHAPVNGDGDGSGSSGNNRDSNSAQARKGAASNDYYV